MYCVDPVLLFLYSLLVFLAGVSAVLIVHRVAPTTSPPWYIAVCAVLGVYGPLAGMAYAVALYLLKTAVCF